MGLVNFLLDEMKTQGRTLGTRVSFNELIQVPKCICTQQAQVSEVVKVVKAEAEDASQINY